MTTKGKQPTIRQEVFQRGPRIKISDIDLIEVISQEGQFGTVWKASVYGYPTAVKELKRKSGKKLTQSDIESFLAEIKIMSEVSHRNICMYLGACVDQDRYFLVTEYCINSLDKMLRDPSYKENPYFKRLEMVHEVCEGLNWSSNYLVHCDLKPANILLGQDGFLKLADFGFAKVLDKANYNNNDVPQTLLGGSPLYMAPERLIDRSIVTSATDVYSFAIVAWEMAQGEPPFRGHNNLQIFTNAVNNGERPSPKVKDVQFQNLLEKAWNSDPNKRPNMLEIKEELEEIKMTAAILDPKAREFWRKSFGVGKNVASHVKWNDFEKKFCSYFQFRSPKEFTSLTAISDNPSQDELERATKSTFEAFASKFPNHPLLGIVRKKRNWVTVLQLLSNFLKEKDEIAMDKFGLFCDNCNLFKEDPKHFLDLVSKPWFWGIKSATETSELLSGQEPGTFLVRISLNSNQLVVSRVSSNGRSIVHIRIEHQDDKYFFTGFQDKGCSSVIELIENEKEKLKIPRPPRSHQDVFAFAEPTEAYYK